MQSLANKLSKVFFMVKSLKKVMSTYETFIFQSSNLFYSLEYYCGGERRIIHIKKIFRMQ